MNRLTGEIPREIFDPKMLSNINVSANNLTGEIPASMVSCRPLTSIDFSQNSLSGEIPKGIANLEILWILNLSINHLNGQIPSEIESMSSLTTLDLSYNDFSGLIPTRGQFLFFNSTSFTGNPNLCQPRVPCSIASNTTQIHGGGQTSFNSSKLVITIIALVTSCWY